MLRRGDEGSLTILVIGYTFIAVVLLVVGIDASKVFLAQRALSSAADAAALAAAQTVDRAAIYRGDGGCARLPVAPDSAAAAARLSLDDAADGLGHTFTSVSAPDIEVEGGAVRVQLRGEVTVPLGRVLARA